MSHNADAIVHELHVEFESMLSYVKDSQTATADQVERGLFRRLLSLGARLMLLFFALRTGAAARDAHRLAIAVGQPVTRLPPHRSRRADFPHRALQKDSLSQRLRPPNAPFSSWAARRSWVSRCRTV